MPCWGIADNDKDRREGLPEFRDGSRPSAWKQECTNAIGC
uniref:Uncharacterized protein n=1 Tax=Rubinisphaera brasiliensis (strain ATCC 49424 / DSM 5305 / JCM 21570 / IAM 15109 / NBRC 103401 / IFAM 1448) TaxID=756272 RepID=F0SM48_RUBBR|nr:hypothetical protein Plabr_3406 [Rubinisphaera brasiliensis DSM 5305]